MTEPRSHPGVLGSQPGSVVAQPLRNQFTFLIVKDLHSQLLLHSLQNSPEDSLVSWGNRSNGTFREGWRDDVSRVINKCSRRLHGEVEVAKVGPLAPCPPVLWGGGSPVEPTEAARVACRGSIAHIGTVTRSGEQPSCGNSFLRGTDQPLSEFGLWPNPMGLSGFISDPLARVGSENTVGWRAPPVDPAGLGTELSCSATHSGLAPDTTSALPGIDQPPRPPSGTALMQEVLAADGWEAPSGWGRVFGGERQGGW